jgi:hypothetical protein
MNAVHKTANDSDTWQESGREPMSRQQQKLLNAACGDLGNQIRWHGIVFGRDDYRHLLAAVVLGERLVPGVNNGHGKPGLIRMSRSSLELNRTQATECIQTAFDIGDNPEDQGLECKAVEWCPVIKMARRRSDSDDELARRYA